MYEDFYMSFFLSGRHDSGNFVPKGAGEILSDFLSWHAVKRAGSGLWLCGDVFGSMSNE